LKKGRGAPRCYVLSVRRFLEAAIGIASLACAACSGSSAPAAPVDAEAPDTSTASGDARADEAGGSHADGGTTDGGEAGVTEIVLPAASFPMADGGTVRCGTDFDGVVVFYAETSDPMPTETGLVPCTTPVVLTPVDPGTAYQLDVYLQKGATIVAQSTCAATTRAGEAVEPTCPTFM
jgi:hypothetical protein